MTEPVALALAGAAVRRIQDRTRADARASRSRRPFHGPRLRVAAPALPHAAQPLAAQPLTAQPLVAQC